MPHYLERLHQDLFWILAGACGGIVGFAVWLCGRRDSLRKRKRAAKARG